MNEKHTSSSSTWWDKKTGYYLHIDRQILPLRVPRRLGAVPPLEPRGQDEKIPAAEPGDADKTKHET